MKASAIILFDGLCNLCSSTVQFIIKHDEKAYFQFASLQSEIGQQLVINYQLPKDLSSFVLIENGNTYLRSAAALQVAGRLTFPWRMLKIFMIVPPFFRDYVYRFISKNRYKWFGKKQTCWLPSPGIKSRFLE